MINAACMTTFSGPYTLTNLPQGFVYHTDTHQLYSPVCKRFAVLNDDGSVTSPTNITFRNVDEYVQLQMFLTTEAFKNRRDRVSEPFTNQYTTVNLGSGHNCILKKETLMLIICFAVALLIMCIITPIILRLAL